MCEKCGQRLPVVSSKYNKKNDPQTTRRSLHTFHNVCSLLSLAENTARNAISRKLARGAAPAPAGRWPGVAALPLAGAVAVPTRHGGRWPVAGGAVAGGAVAGGRGACTPRGERGVYAAVRASSSTTPYPLLYLAEPGEAPLPTL